MVDVALFLQYAQVAQQSDAYANANRQIFNGGTSVNRYVRLLYIVRKAVQWKYDQNSTDSTLDLTANYMYALSRGRNVTPTPPVTTFIIIIQPSSLTVDSGDNASFLVAVAGGTQPYSYQWRFNGTPIGGETNPTLDLTNVDSGDAGAYSCVITDAIGRILTSTNATLTVTAASITAYWWWSADTDPYPDLSTGTDNLTYLGSVSFAHLASIVIPWPSGSANNTYKVVRYPLAELAKNHFKNTDLNQGGIPSVAYHEIVTIGSNLYIISKGDSIFTPFTVTYSIE